MSENTKNASAFFDLGNQSSHYTLKKDLFYSWNDLYILATKEILQSESEMLLQFEHAAKNGPTIHCETVRE